MNMALIELFTISAVITVGNAVFMRLECKSEFMGVFGQQSMLECTVKTEEDITKPLNVTAVTWKKKRANESLVSYYFKWGPEPRYTRRFSFAEPAWNNTNLNISLLIADTTVEDAGVYECTVVTTSGKGISYITLNLSAKYNKPTIISRRDPHNPNPEDTLQCVSEGYPKGRIRWFDAYNNEWTESAKMETKQTTNGMYQLFSTLTLKKGSIFPPYTCVVYNVSGGKEDETKYDVPDKPITEERKDGEGADSLSKVVAPLVVIGSLIVGLLLAVLIYKKRTRRGQPNYEPEEQLDMMPEPEKINNMA